VLDDLPVLVESKDVDDLAAALAEDGYGPGEQAVGHNEVAFGDDTPDVDVRSGLDRRDAGTAAVRQTQVTLVEGRASCGVTDLLAGIRSEELERQLEWMLDNDTTTKNDRAHTRTNDRRTPFNSVDKPASTAPASRPASRHQLSRARRAGPRRCLVFSTPS
jgi:hypothetical protein